MYDEEKSLRFQNVLGTEGKTLTRWGARSTVLKAQEASEPDLIFY